MRRALTLLLLPPLIASGCGSDQGDQAAISAADIAGAEAVIGLTFTPDERHMMLPDLLEQQLDYASLREQSLPHDLAPALSFAPWPATMHGASKADLVEWPMPAPGALPADASDLAFFPLTQLAALIEARKISVRMLTELYLERLKRFGPRLEAVITITEARALAQADRLDAELERGVYRGVLHGIPYAAKDLIAVAGYPTTWGAAPFRDQQLEETATVIRKLDEAGAVLLAKTSVGALAWGDVWFAGQTRNPWNPAEGSSGSSAGSAAAVSAGLVPFALGTETWGSIVSPATRVGVSGLRPTFGRVSRSGVMALSWSMDKVGVLCRHIEDCGLVLAAIEGADPADPDSREAPLELRPRHDLRGLRIGVVERDFDALDYEGRQEDQNALRQLEALGAELVPLTLPALPAQALAIILNAEAAAAFDELTRTGRDDELVRQQRDAWPNVFRAARLIPAVEYIQANRVRRRLVAEIRSLFGSVDLYVAPSVAGENLLITNLTGHPAVVVPTGFADPASPVSLTFAGPYFSEGRLVAVAEVFQRATGAHRSRPPGY